MAPAKTANGYDTKIAVLAEQMKQLGSALAEHRQDTKEFRDDVRNGLSGLRAEVVARLDKHEEQDRAYHQEARERMDRHDEQDSKNFKAIDDRMILGEKAESARVAVDRYKKTQWSLIGGAVATILWNLIRVAEPIIHRALSGQ